MRTTFITVLNQHVQGFNAKAGQVAGLPGLTAFNGFLTAFAMKLSELSSLTFVPRGLTIAVSSLSLRRGQPTYIWSGVNRDGGKSDDDLQFPEGFTDAQKKKSRLASGKAKNASMAGEVQGDALLHFILELTQDDDEGVDEASVEDVLSHMRLAGGELPSLVPHRVSRTVNISDSYDQALALIPSSAWILEDATPAFEAYLGRHPEQSVFSAFLTFTSNHRRRVLTSDEKKNSPEDSASDPKDPAQDEELLRLPHRMPMLVGWRQLSEPTMIPQVQRVKGAPTVMVEAVHGVVFARFAGVVRHARAGLTQDTSPPLTHFRWTWKTVGGAPAGLMLGEACL